MALPQDGVNANALAKVTTIPTGKELIFIDPTTNEGGVITLEDLTKQILQNLTSQTFALDQGTKTLPAALNELNSNKIYRETISGTNTLEDYYVSNGKLPGAYKVTGVIIPNISKSVSWYGILLLLPVYDVQIVIVGGGRIFVRDKTGSPTTWQVWKQYTCTDIVKS